MDQDEYFQQKLIKPTEVQKMWESQKPKEDMLTLVTRYTVMTELDKVPMDDYELLLENEEKMIISEFHV